MPRTHGGDPNSLLMRLVEADLIPRHAKKVVMVSQVGAVDQIFWESYTESEDLNVVTKRLANPVRIEVTEIGTAQDPQMRVKDEYLDPEPLGDESDGSRDRQGRIDRSPDTDSADSNLQRDDWGSEEAEDQG